jgi:hypothetical protein
VGGWRSGWSEVGAAGGFGRCDDDEDEWLGAASSQVIADDRLIAVLQTRKLLFPALDCRCLLKFIAIVLYADVPLILRFAK